MESSKSRLSQLQRDVLNAFFEREQRFVLTGGSALGGFHLGHRESKDLDLFAQPPASVDDAEHALQDAVRVCGATMSGESRYAEFRRFVVTRDEERTLVDLVIDRVAEIDPMPVTFGNVRVHSMREIAANKICTLLSRCEIRDLFDLQALLDAGISLEQALADGAAKDAGVNPATLAWLLSELSIAPDAPLPGEASAERLETFRQELVRRLRALAAPSEPRA